MKKDYSIYLYDILDSIEQVEKYFLRVTKKSFSKDIKLQDAVVRRLEVIGEAAGRIPDAMRAKNPEIDWKNITGTRSKLIHDYAYVDLDIVWTIVKKDLAKLKKQIKEMIKENKA